MISTLKIEYLRTYTDLAFGASGAGLVVIGWRGQGVKGQEKEHRSSHKDFPGWLHLGATAPEDTSLGTEADN